jgi:hypothetical protein
LDVEDPLDYEPDDFRNSVGGLLGIDPCRVDISDFRRYTSKRTPSISVAFRLLDGDGTTGNYQLSVLQSDISSGNSELATYLLAL